MHNFKQPIKKLTALMLIIMMLVGSMSFNIVNAWRNGTSPGHVDVRVEGQFVIQYDNDADNIHVQIPVMAEIPDASNLKLVYNNTTFDKDFVASTALYGKGWWPRESEEDGKEWQIGDPYEDVIQNGQTISKLISGHAGAESTAVSNKLTQSIDPHEFTISGTLYILRSSIVNKLTAEGLSNKANAIIDEIFSDTTKYPRATVNGADYITYPFTGYNPNFNYCTYDTFQVLNPQLNSPFYGSTAATSKTSSNGVGMGIDPAHSYQFNAAGGYDFIIFAGAQFRDSGINVPEDNQASIAFKKIVKDENGNNISSSTDLSGFQFEVYDGQDKETANKIGNTLSTGSDGVVIFTSTALTANNTYYVFETAESAFGYTMQPYTAIQAHKLITDLELFWTYDVGSGVWMYLGNTADVPTFTNTVNPTPPSPATGNITITKQVIDKDTIELETIPEGASFTFTLKKGEEVIDTKIADKTNGFVITFEDIPADTYTIEESFDGDYVDVTGPITVIVTDDGQGNAIVTDGGEFTWTNQIDPFVAIRKVIQNKLGVTLEDQDLSIFSFNVYDNDERNGNPIGSLTYCTEEDNGIYYGGSVEYAEGRHYYVFEDDITGYTPGQPNLYVEVTAYATLAEAIGNATEFINISTDPWDSVAEIKITKHLDGNVAGGFEFTIICEDLDYTNTVTSGSDGVVDFGKLPVGYTYIINEVLENSEITDKTGSITVKIAEDGTVTYEEGAIYNNVTKTYPIEIVKKLDGNAKGGFDFELYDAQNKFIERVTSDENGKVKFENQPAGTYTIKEVDLDTTKYVDQTKSVTVTIPANTQNTIFEYNNKTIINPKNPDPKDPDPEKKNPEDPDPQNPEPKAPDTENPETPKPGLSTDDISYHDPIPYPPPKTKVDEPEYNAVPVIEIENPIHNLTADAEEIIYINDSQDTPLQDITFNYTQEDIPVLKNITEEEIITNDSIPVTSYDKINPKTGTSPLHIYIMLVLVSGIIFTLKNKKKIVK